MKSTIWMGALLILAATPALAAQNSCERVRTQIEQRIIKNGVSENAFTLTIVPNDQADQSNGQVVGHCANDTQKIVYSRNDSAQ